MDNSLVIETNRLTKQYGKQTVVDHVNLHIKKGEIYGLLGRNGAGKTTIMKMLLGLAATTSGEAYIFGHSINHCSNDVYERIGNIIETPSFYPNLSGYDNLRVFAKLKGTVSRDAVKKVLEFVSLPYQDKKPFSKYSLGMKQRLGIANALMNDPELLILDEPTNGLDPIGIAEVRELFKDLSVNKGKTIVISSHQLSEIEQIANTIGILHEGALLEECNMEEVAKQNQKHICITVSDASKAAVLLEQKLGIESYVISKLGTIKIFDFSYTPQTINSLFCGEGIEVSSLFIGVGNLEEHFRTITGGEGIA